jgi:prepilin-type N-terminal cleavage/methylation domain-containing protein
MTKRQQQQNLSESRDGGYTIIESLVAMIVVSVLMIAIAPVMAFSVATRVQARRVELATQAARTYIDALRTGAIKPEPGDEDVPGFPKRALGELADAPVPAVGDTYCVDMDGDTDTDGEPCETTSNKDFRVQGAWRNPDPSITPTDPTSKGYQLLVRVYRADSFDGSVTLRTRRPDETKQSVVGLGDRTMPVVEMSTEIPATGDPSYRSISDRLKQR